MIFAVIFLFIISIILFVGNYNDESSRWSGFLSFVGALGALAIFLEYQSYPDLVVNYGIQSNQANFVKYGAYVLSSVYYYFLPYIFLMLGIFNVQRISQTYLRTKNILKYLLLLPCVAMIPFFGLTPAKSPHFWIIALWAVPYISIAILLLILSFYMEQNPKVKRDKLFDCIILIPIALVVLFTNYLLIAMGITDAWKYNSWLVIFTVTSFTFFLFNYSAMGVKLKIEKNYLEGMLGAMSSGTAVLIHAFKNETAKIALCSENTKKLIPKIPEENLSRLITMNIDAIANSSQHLLAMVMKIQESMQEITLKETPLCLSEMLDQTLALVQIYIAEKKIRVEKNYLHDFTILFDETHMLEMLKNIIMNAIEAVEENGILQPMIYRKNRHVIIEIKDNGPGISPEKLSRVIEPFYSTKKNKLNFGLGLPYCYNVMKKHGGSLSISSEKGKGTSVYLNFNPKKVLRHMNP
ncbi:MAG TPA: HAMP domain-containing sensor histidine kinase [Bacillota bacterium]|nr:HAMP domain-containing sensor histidine kinase [Bacillota bacterium]